MSGAGRVSGSGKEASPLARKLQSRDLYSIMQSGTLDANEVHQAYNALDSAVTLRVWENLRTRVSESPHAQVSYNFSRAMQGPAMDMMKRGVAIQAKVRQDETERYLTIRNQAQSLLDRLADAVWGPEEITVVDRVKELYTPLGKRGQHLTPRWRTIRSERRETRPRGLNASSDKQCLAFFNTALGFPVEYEIRKTPQGTERTPTANAKALRKWAERRTKGPGVSPRDRTIPAVKLAAPFVSLILTIREADKMLAVLRTPLDPDGRMRCSYNVAATENWRWSSSKNVYGRGTNLQNITPSMRRMFCADDGYRFISTDLEQAESYVTAVQVWLITGDDTYWRAILSGDLHTQVCRMAWPELPWTGDAKSDREIADRPYPGLKYSYRDVAKRIGHGSNYDGSAFGIAQAVGIPFEVVADFQARYFAAFPAIREYHRWVRGQIREHQYLDTPLGQRRYFFGRPTEDATFREAIACVPQGTVGSLLNLVMWRVWQRSLLDPLHEDHIPVQLLLQNHDAFLSQSLIIHSLPAIIHAMNTEFQNASIPVTRGSDRRLLTIPGEFVTGFNWAYADKGSDKTKWTFADGNPDGLRKWSGADDRRRVQGAVARPGDWLNRPLSPTHR